MILSCALLAGCGGGGKGAAKPAATPTGVPNETRERSVPALTDANGTTPGTMIFFRRYRYAGATVIKLALNRDGRVAIEQPNGGAGRKAKAGELAPAKLREVRRAIDAVPWRHLSKRRVKLDGSGGYYLITHGSQDLTVEAASMSVDLLPLVKRLNRIVDSPANKTTYRYLNAS